MNRKLKSLHLYQLSNQSVITSLVFFCCLLVIPTSASALFDKKPSKSDVRKEFQKPLKQPKLRFKLSKPEILVKEKLGSKTDLNWAYRLEMTAKFAEGHYLLENKVKKELYTPAVKKGVKFIVGGVTTASYRNGSWKFDTKYDSREIYPLAENLIAVSTISKDKNILEKTGGYAEVKKWEHQIETHGMNIGDVELDVENAQDNLDRTTAKYNEVKTKRTDVHMQVYGNDESTAAGAAKKKWVDELEACRVRTYEAAHAANDVYDKKIRALRKATKAEAARARIGCKDVLNKLKTAIRDAKRNRTDASKAKAMRTKVSNECRARYNEINKETEDTVKALWAECREKYGNGLDAERRCLKDPKKNSKWGELKEAIAADPEVQKYTAELNNIDTQISELYTELKQLRNNLSEEKKNYRDAQKSHARAIELHELYLRLYQDSETFMKSSETSRFIGLPKN